MTGSWARSEWGTGMAVGKAWGTSWLNLWKLNRERASATTLEDPATWWAVNAKECRAANMERWQSSIIMFKSLDEPDHNTSATAVLLEQNSTHVADHWWPHKETTRTTRRSSLYTMENGIWAGDHTPTDCSCPRIALYPVQLAASHEIWRSGRGVH